MDQLIELHNNFIYGNCFVNIGQVVEDTLKQIIADDGQDNQLQLSKSQIIAGVKTSYGMVLPYALQNIAIRVNCEPVTKGANGGERKICQLYIRCLCCNETECVNTQYLYVDWGGDKYKGFSSAGSAENSKAVGNKITDIIIKDYIKRHLFHDIGRKIRNHLT